MNTKLLYVEQIQGHTGPAWIGYGQFSKSGKTVYFDGKALKKEQGIIGNHYDLDNGDEYWVSGVKKNGADRHWAGSGKIYLDKAVVDDYLQITGQLALPKNKFILADLNNVPIKELSYEIENENKNPDEESFMRDFSSPKELSDDDLEKAIEYHRGILPELYKKGRKDYRKFLKTLNEELESRRQKLVADQ